EETHQVRLHHDAPVFFVPLHEELGAPGQPGVVHQDLWRLDGGGEGLAALPRGHVQGERPHLDAGELVAQRLEPLHAPRPEHQIAAQRRQLPGGRRPDARRRTRHHGPRSLEIHGRTLSLRLRSVSARVGCRGNLESVQGATTRARPIRGRFAPSPTGDPHLGNAHAALLAWLSVRAQGGSFVLRMEDLDKPREKPGAADSILRALRWLGLDWDEGPDVGGAFGPYVQSERLSRYEAAVRRLLDDGLAYECWCSRK